jgi:hypothetical protein
MLHTLGLAYDPFLYSVAEQELGYAPDGFFASYDYAGPSNKDALLSRLAKPCHSLVVAPQGAGKTTLRLHLMRKLHQVSPGVLPVTCELAALEAGQHLNGQDAAQAAIAGEISKDLLIALFDSFDPFAPAEIPLHNSLAHILRCLLQQATLARLLQRIIAAPDGTPLNIFWRTLGRPGLPAVSWVSAELRTFAAEIQALSTLEPGDCSGHAAGRVPAPRLEDVIAAAQALGFAHIFLLIDSVDASLRTVHKVADLLAPFAQLAVQHPGLFYLKLFAPPGVWDSLAELPAAAVASIQPLDLIRLHWTDERLDQALLQRLRAAGANINAGTALFDRADASRLYAELLAIAAGSPRRLFHCISLIIDAHVAAGSQKTALTYEDWQASRQQANQTAFLH